MRNSCGWTHAEAQSGSLTGNPAPAIGVGQPEPRLTLPVRVHSSRFDPEVVVCNYRGDNDPKRHLTASQRTGWSVQTVVKNTVRVKRLRESRKDSVKSKCGMCPSGVDVGVFCRLGGLGPVYSSAARALIFIQASTRTQTVIHAGPRQRDATEKKPNITLTSFPHTQTHMNESLVRVFLTLALEPLFPKAPAKTKTATFNTAAGGKCINSGLH